MIEEGKFGVQETVWLMVSTIVTKVFYTSPAQVASLVGNVGWYMTLISTATAILGFTFIYLLLKRFPGWDIATIMKDTLGGFFGFVFSIALALYLLFLATNTLSEFTEVAKAYVFLLTPSSFIIGIFVVGILVMCILGLETQARFAKLAAYTMLTGFVLVLILGTENYDINRLFPILGYGADKILITGLARSSVYGEIVILAVIAPSLQGTYFVKKAGYISLILSGLLISLSVLAYSLSFPYYVAQEIVAPMYEMAELIDYGRFVQRVEPIFLFIWFFSSFISITALFYCFVSLYCKIFRIQDIRPIALGSALILFVSALFNMDLGVGAVQRIQNIRQYGWIPPFILPLIALIVGMLRKRGVRSHE